MKSLQGFVNINRFFDQTYGNVATIGELSSWSRTYRKDNSTYIHPAFPGMAVLPFHYVNLSTDERLSLNEEEVEEVLKVVTTLIAHSESHVRPFDEQNFKDYMSAMLTGVIYNSQYGEWVNNDTTTLPDWYSWTSARDPEFEVKIWLADSSFKEQYELYEITVVPPVENIDDLMGTYTSAMQKVNEMSFSKFSARLQEAKGEYAETVISTIPFKFHNRDNLEIFSLVDFGLLIYGQAGDNIDAKKDAIIEYIEDNSSHSLAEWEVVLPELFKRTEFFILPRWDIKSIPNLSYESSFYGTMISPHDQIAIAKELVTHLDTAWVDDNILSFVSTFRHVSLVTINGNNNSEGKERLEDLYPDYIPIPSTHPDFTRLSMETRDWMLKLDKGLQLAEEATTYTSLPIGYRKTKHGDVLYIAFNIDSVNFKIASGRNQVYLDRMIP